MNNNDQNIAAPQRDVVFNRKNGWMPQVVRRDGTLYIELGAGANANHDPRTFSFPISEEHLEVIKNDFTRHLLLWAAILPLCDAAGTSGPLDQDAAIALLDPILLGSEAEIEVLLKDISWTKGQLIAHRADPALLDAGDIFAAMKTVTEESDWTLTTEYQAKRLRALRGVVLSDFEAAILRYTNQYLHGGGLPSRKPEAVDPVLLPQVLEVITIAEKACAGMELPSNWGKNEDHAKDKAEWHRIQDTVDEAVRQEYPDLADEAVRTVSFLMCSEAADRSRHRSS